MNFLADPFGKYQIFVVADMIRHALKLGNIIRDNQEEGYEKCILIITSQFFWKT